MLTIFVDKLTPQKLAKMSVRQFLAKFLQINQNVALTAVLNLVEFRKILTEKCVEFFI